MRGAALNELLIEKAALLERTFENLSEGFGLFDAADRLVVCNSRFRDLQPQIRDLIVPGVRHADLIRANAYSGAIAEAVGREEDYLRERFLEHGLRNGSFERVTADGRRLMVTDQRFDDGSSCVVITEITELRAREVELERSAATIETTFRHMDQGIAVFDSSLRYVAFNQRYVDLLDLPPEIAMVGGPIEGLIRFRAERGDFGGGEIDDIVRTRLAKLKSGETQTYDFTGPDGRVVEMHGRSTKAGGYVVTYSDISDRARREQEMQLLLAAGQAITHAGDADAALVAALRIIGETTGWPYAEAWRPDPERRLLVLSPAWYAADDPARAFRLATDTSTLTPGLGLAGRVWKQGMPEWIPDLSDVNREAVARYAAASQAGLQGALGVPVLGGANEVLAVLCFYMPRFREGDRNLLDIVGAVAGQLGVYLEKKLAEDALRDSEDRFRAFAEAASDYFTILDENLRYRYISPRTCDVFGIDATQVAGAERGGLITLTPGQEATFEAHRLTLAAREPFRDFLFAAYAKDGTIRHVRSSGKPIFDPDGRFRGYYTVGTDITEQKQLETQLHQAQKMEAVGQLTGGIAHDFNNLLTVVMGNLQLLERGIRGDARREKQVRMSLDAAKRGSELTKRLLAFSRRQVLAPERAKLNDLVEGMVPLLKRTLGETIGLEIRLDGTLGATRIDVAQFESALLNLTVNARDAMPDGGTLLIETATTRLDARDVAGQAELAPGRYVVVSVSDTGSGIPGELLDRVFDPFFTTKEVGKGSGLGLSMVYGFARQSKGNVTIDSEAGKGTTVRLYFPRTEAEAAPAAAAPALETVVPGGDETILLVEDEAAVRETVALILEDYGYTVVAAENGPAALETLMRFDRVDLLLTDVVMPGGMNGRELADRMKVLHPGVKVLITSGYPQETISKDGILDEGIAFIGKPYDHEDLARKIRELLDG